MPLLFRFELFDLKVAAESVGLPREKWLYRVACQRGKSRETKRVDYTGKVACPLLSCPFFKICTTQFFPPFRAVREGCVYTCMRVKARIQLKRTREKIVPPRIDNACFFSMIRGTRLPMFITKLPPRSPSQNQRISYSKSFSNLCAAQYHSFPQNRCLLLAELGLGVCLPSLSFKRFFCLPLPRWTFAFSTFPRLN